VQARRDIVAEYEHVCEAAGAVAGVIDLSTFGLAHCALRTTAGLTGTGSSSRHGRRRHDRDLPRPSSRVLQAARRGRRRASGRTRPPDRDVLPGSSRRERFRPRPRRSTARPRSPVRRGWASSRGSACALNWSRRRGARLTPHWPTPSLGFGLAASLWAECSAMARPLRINLSTRPFYNERGVTRCCARCGDRAGGLGVQPLAGLRALGRHAELERRISLSETKTRELKTRRRRSAGHQSSGA